MSYTVKDILKLEVAPALGCTEPVAIALSTAAAASLFPDRQIDTIECWIDANIYKNGFAVSIPGTEGEAGMDLAAALGAVAGDPALKLEALRPLTADDVRAAKKIIEEKRITIHLLEDKSTIYVRSRLTRKGREAEAVITDLHDNITSLKLDGKEIKKHPLLSISIQNQNEVQRLESWLKDLSLKDLIALLDDLDEEDMEFLRQGVEANVKLAEYGLKFGPGLGVGLALERMVREGLLKKDMILEARIQTSAASDARMSGVNLPAMSSAGSGNHGLTAILPIWAVRGYLHECHETDLLRAIALSHMITALIKAHTGRLSAICGCSIAAGAGATGGLTFLMGGNLHHIAGAIKNVAGDLAGVICDGAKAGCALKLATAAGNAVQSALFALHGLDVKGTDGIVAHSTEQTLRNLGELSTQGMIEADRIIIQIMLKKQFEAY